MALTMEQAVAQLQREVYTLIAEVAAEFDSRMQGEPSTISRMPSLRKILRTSSTLKPLVVRRIPCQRGGFSTVVQEDGGLLRGSDQGV